MDHVFSGRFVKAYFFLSSFGEWIVQRQAIGGRRFQFHRWRGYRSRQKVDQKPVGGSSSARRPMHFSKGKNRAVGQLPCNLKEMEDKTTLGK